MKIHAILWNLSHTKVLREMTIEETPWIHISVLQPEWRFIQATVPVVPPVIVTVKFVPFGWANGSFRTIHFHPESIPSVKGCEEYL